MSYNELIECEGEYFDSEECPHCEGTGRRIVPPPAMSGPGLSAGNGGRTHGYESTYIAGCKCMACRAAHREGVKRRKNKAS